MSKCSAPVVGLDLVLGLCMVRRCSMYWQVAQFLPQRYEPVGICGWGLVESEESLAETNKSRRLGDRLEATTGKFGKKRTS